MNPEEGIANVQNIEENSKQKKAPKSKKDKDLSPFKGKQAQKSKVEYFVTNYSEPGTSKSFDMPSCSYQNNTKQQVPNNFGTDNTNNKHEDEPGNAKEKKDEGQAAKIEWPEKDLMELVRRMELALPEKDTLAFNTRVEKLDWEEIAFKPYSGEECKRTWMSVQKRLRRFRILSELLSDAKEWMNKPWTNFYKGGKTKRHPEMPRRPLSSYMLFYLQKKDKILEENPGIDMTEVSKKIAVMYKSINPQQREMYSNLAAEERKEYEEKLNEFHRKYPDVPTTVEKTSQKCDDKLPKKPLTPFGLFYKEQLRQFVNNPTADRNSIKEKCKEQWRNMSDKKKVVWIDWALEEESKYQEELKKYVSQNSDYVPIPIKPLLTKEEKIIKQRVMGKPVKPPNSAYSLFSTLMLQSEKMKTVSPKNRMNVIANQWKICTEEEKKQYKEKAMHLMDQYKLDFATYLESLPEDKRREELKNNLPKRKTKPPVEPEENKKKKPNLQQPQPPKEQDESAILAELFKGEPKQPPVSAFALFSANYHGSEPANVAWRAIPHDQKKRIDNKVIELKHAYLKDYEKFLKSLTKKQLTAYSNFKKSKAVKIEEQESLEDDDEECDGCTSGSETGSCCSA